MRRERNPSRDARPCSRVSVATVNRRPRNFTGGLSYRTKQVGHPFYDPHVEYTSGISLSRASSTPSFRPLVPLSRAFVTALRIRLSNSINFQWMLVKSALLAVIRADMLTKGHVRSPRRYGRRPRSGLSGDTSSLRRKNDRNLRNGEESVGVGGVSGPLVNCLARKTELLCPIPHVSARTGDHFDQRFPNFSALCSLLILFINSCLSFP